MLRTQAYLGLRLSLRILRSIPASVPPTWPTAVACHVMARCYELRCTYLADEEPGHRMCSRRRALTTSRRATQRARGPASTPPTRRSWSWGQNIAVLMGIFAAAGLLALILHTIIVEDHINLTPGKPLRLREVSKQRQEERRSRVMGQTASKKMQQPASSKEGVVGSD